MARSPLRSPSATFKKRDIAILISQARVRELKYVQTVLQKAELAAFQCLEKRVEAIEKLVTQEKKERGPLRLADFFVDVLIDIMLGKAGGYLKDSVEAMLKPI